MKKVTVIGGGPAGMFAAITAAGCGHDVTLIEKNDCLGKKLSLTGGGRCNLTYKADPEELIENVVGNPSFLYSAFYTFGSDSLISFFEDRGVPIKIENNRAYPNSDKATDIVNALENALKECNVRVCLNHNIENFSQLQQYCEDCDAVIITTGGKSYPSTGCIGDGYRFAKELGHTITETSPALVPLLCNNVDGLAGLSLKDIRLTVGKHTAYGDLLFTHKGISGPTVLQIGRYYKSGDEVSIDLLPDIAENELDKLLVNEFMEHPNKSVENILATILPKKLVPDMPQAANEVTKQSRTILVHDIKNFQLEAKSTAGYKEAMITAGGVSVKEINPSTMQSKINPKFYFAGEVIDVDALTGGFNLQIAFSTGYLAGLSV